MSRITILVAAGAAAVLAALVASASAPAVGSNYLPLLSVSQPGAGVGYVLNTQLKSDTPTETGRISLYAPKGFKATFPANVGDAAGTASVRLELADTEDKLVTAKGTAVVAAPAKLACAAANAPAPVASLTLTLTGDGGLTMTIPMALYTVTGAAAQYSSYVLTQCFPAPGVPQGTAGRAPAGARVVSESLTLPGLSGPKYASSYWTAAWTPFTHATATLDDASSMAAQAVTGAPRFLLDSSTTVSVSKQNGKQVTKTTVTIGGRVTRGKLGAVRTQVNVHYGLKPSHLVSTKWVTTDAGGRFIYSTTVKPPYRYFQAFAKLPARTYPAASCQPSIVPYPCTGLSTSRDTALSNVVKVVAD
jgi:hypothetical protein